MGKNHKRKDKNQKRCIFSNKLVSNKDVVIVEYAPDYVRKMGFEIKKANAKEIIRRLCLFTILFSFFTLSFLAIVSAQELINGEEEPKLLELTPIDLLNGNGAFDTYLQFEDWLQSSSGTGTITHDTAYYYAGGGSLRIATTTGTNLMFNGNATEYFSFNNSVYGLKLECDLANTNNPNSATYCNFDEVYLINEGNNTNLSFIWSKNYLSTSLPTKNILNVWLLKEGQNDILLFNNSALTFATWNTQTIDVSEYFPYTEIEPEEQSIFYIDFDKTINIIVFILIFIVGGLFYFLKLKEFTAFIFFLEGLMLLFNDINIILSLFLISLGILIGFERSNE